MKTALGILVCIALIILGGIWTGSIRPSPAKVANALTRPASEDSQVNGRSLITLEYVNEKLNQIDRRIDLLTDRIIALETDPANPEVSIGYLEDEIYVIGEAVGDLEGALALLEEDVSYALGWIDEIYAVICFGDLVDLNQAAMCD